jgi:hypothetical protein
MNPGWSSLILPLSDLTNNADIIDFFIEYINALCPLKAVLCIGDDIEYDLKGSYQGMTKLSTTRWSTTTSHHICISILYPNPTGTYEEKCDQIQRTLDRFATVRTKPRSASSYILESSSVNHYSKDAYQMLAQGINASYQCNPSSAALQSLTTKSSSLLCLHGHASSSSVCINESKETMIGSRTAAYIPATMLAVDGCYTNGIILNQSSSSGFPFISAICESTTMHVGFFGLLSQQIDEEQNVITTLLPSLLQGICIADAFQDIPLLSDLVITGDPSFHFS